jgi:hypothetical protein
MDWAIVTDLVAINAIALLAVTLGFFMGGLKDEVRGHGRELGEIKRAIEQLNSTLVG